MKNDYYKFYPYQYIDNNMIYIKVLLFLLVLLTIYTYLYSDEYGCNVLSTIRTENVIKTIGGFSPIGFSTIYNIHDKPKHVLIVDVANLYNSWYKTKYEKRIHYYNQRILFDYYVEAMKAHHKKYKKLYTCHYVIKNFKTVGRITKALNIEDKDIKRFQKFCKDYKVFISIAKDYTGVKKSIWDSPKYHYIRERDDFLCFWLAKAYKKAYITSTIMTNDKFKDFSQFGFVPEFTAIHINEKRHITRKVKPRPNILGQFRDYNIIKID